MNAFQQSLVQRLVVLDDVRQIVFALLCAERLRPCCIEFAKQNNRDVSPYLAAIDLAFASASKPVAGVSVNDTVGTDWQRCTPDFQEFEDCLSEQALAGMLALAHALENGDMKSLLHTSQQLIEAVDDYIFQQSSDDGREFDHKQPHLLRDREMRKQLDDCEWLESQATIDEQAISDRRATNLSFAIPCCHP